MEFGDDFELTERLVCGTDVRRGSLSDDGVRMRRHHGLLVISRISSKGLAPGASAFNFEASPPGPTHSRWTRARK
jgi:hypothetical protein